MTWQWVIWISFAVATVILFGTWLIKRKGYQHGKSYDTRVVVALHSGWRIAIAETILLICFFFVDINNLHLLWSYPLIYFIIQYRVARKIVKTQEDETKG